MIGALPWAWIIPFNQWFWDDWLTAPLTGWREQIDRWDGGAKHYLNPVVYFLLVPLGPWSFQVLTLLGALVVAIALSQIISKTPGISSTIAIWTGPFCLVLPVFHARFSAAVLEYMTCLAALLLAWSILLRSSKRRRWLFSIPLLIYAIGVPSLAILIPLAWAHVIHHDRSTAPRISWSRLAFKYSPIVGIPFVYALIFQFLLNSRNRYQISVGALIEFARGLLVLLVGNAIVLLLVRIRQRQIPKGWYWILGLATGAYCALFPYFAVGYNPLADFLPWRMRESVISSALIRLPVVLTLLICTAVVTFVVAERQFRSRSLMRAMPIMMTVALFGVIMVILGPMDWESRHWIIAWPVLAVLFAVLVDRFTSKDQVPTFIAVFSTLLLSTVMISSEYLVDVFKQDSIIAQSERELASEIRFASSQDERIVVVMVEDESTNSLNARNRSYRPYEWWGLISRGLGIDPEQLVLLTSKDLETQGNESCIESPIFANVIHPKVKSSWTQALFERRVRIELNPRPMTLCSIQVIDGWPRSS